VRADRQLALERSQRLGHMVGANWFFVSLAAHARRTGSGELRVWMAERAATEHLYDFRIGDGALEAHPHPDGLGIWAEDSTDIVFLLEYDTGSEHLRQLAGRLDRYAEMAGHRMVFQVPILFCFPAPRREQNARRALDSHPGSSVLQIATAAFDPSLTCPAGPVWMPLRGWPGRPMRLIELDKCCPTPGAKPAPKTNTNAVSANTGKPSRNEQAHAPGSTIPPHPALMQYRPLTPMAWTARTGYDPRCAHAREQACF
jgi:hypothetical protein